MSIKIMTKIWESGPDDRGALLVLLALADFSDDKGNCWPAMQTIADKARMTERGAQKIIARLVEDGWIEVKRGGGRHGCNIYTINPERGSVNAVHPEHGSPRTGVHKPRTRVQETPNGGSPEPLGTVNRTVNKDQPASGPGFSEFWEGWPLKKVAKSKATVAFNRLSQQNRQEAIDRMEVWARQWRAAYPTASDIHPTTYLNGKRWNDEFGTGQSPERSAQLDKWRRASNG